MIRRSGPAFGVALVIGLAIGPAALAAAAANIQAHPMLIGAIPADMWPGQRDVRPTDYPAEQKSLRADVAHFLRGRFKVVGDRLFVIPPDGRFVLAPGPFQLGGPGQFQSIDSAPIFDHPPHVRMVPDVLTGSKAGHTVLTVGATLSGKKIYTAIALHIIPKRDDELIGYFQLDPPYRRSGEGTVSRQAAATS